MDKAPFFRTSNINWTRFVFNLTGISLAWGMMSELIPNNTVFRKTAAVLALVVFLFSYFTRSGKWAEERQDLSKPVLSSPTLPSNPNEPL